MTAPAGDTVTATALTMTAASIKSFFKTPPSLEIPGCNPPDTRIPKPQALTLSLFRDLEGGLCHSGVRRLEWMTARKRQTIINSICKLERRKWLTVKRGGIGKKKGASSYQARCRKGHLKHLPQGAPLVPTKVPLGTTELFMSSEETSSPNGAASSVCDCHLDLPAGRHLLECPFGEATT